MGTIASIIVQWLMRHGYKRAIKEAKKEANGVMSVPFCLKLGERLRSWLIGQNNKFYNWAKKKTPDIVADDNIAIIFARAMESDRALAQYNADHPNQKIEFSSIHSVTP